jgi:hypothetical protein
VRRDTGQCQACACVDSLSPKSARSRDAVCSALVSYADEECSEVVRIVAPIVIALTPSIVIPVPELDCEVYILVAEASETPLGVGIDEARGIAFQNKRLYVGCTTNTAY